MTGFSDAVNWYGRTYPQLDKAGEERAISEPDPEKSIALHAVYYVIRGLVLRQKRVTASMLSSIVAGITDSASEWMKTDRSMLSRDYILEYVFANFEKITRDSLLVFSSAFVSLDQPVGRGENSHGGEPQTFGDIISDNLGGRSGSTLSPFVTGHAEVDGLVYDPQLEAYVRADLIKNRKEHVRIERKTVETGIYSYSEEVQRENEKRLENLSPIRSSRISDRIVGPTKARLKRCKKSFRGQRWTPPKLGESATGMPTRHTDEGVNEVHFDFVINKARNHWLQQKCLGCVYLNACSSWLCGGFFCPGIHGPSACAGPFTGEESVK